MSFFSHAETLSEKPQMETVEVEVDTVKVRANIQPQKDRYVLKMGSKYIKENPFFMPAVTFNHGYKEGEQLQETLAFTDHLFMAWSTEDLSQAIQVKEVYGCKILKLKLERATEEVE